MSKSLVVFACLIVAATLQTLGQRITQPPPLNQRLLVVSFDGFRQLYLNSTLLPWFNNFGKTGVISNKIRSVFPSDTFPNHWSIATGMYSENHGIVSNEFWDPNLNDWFYMNSLDVKFWNASTPIWTTARRQGVKKTSVVFWPGSAVQFDEGKGTPNYYHADYDISYPFDQRIQETVYSLVEENVDLAFLYFHEPDSVGHNSGTNSDTLHETIQKLDWYLSYLLQALDNHGLGDDKLNVILCADHGMINVHERLYLGDYMDMDAIEVLPEYGAYVSIKPKPGKLDEMMANLTLASQETGLFQAYLKKDVPTKFHYSHNDRIMDIVIICNTGVYMARSPNSQGTASHGFDPSSASMQPIFMAKGPAFKKRYEATKVFETKDIYAIIAHVVGIVESDEVKDANFDVVADMFAPQEENISGVTTVGYFHNCMLMMTTMIVVSLLHF